MLCRSPQKHRHHPPPHHPYPLRDPFPQCRILTRRGPVLSGSHPGWQDGPGRWVEQVLCPESVPAPSRITGSDTYQPYVSCPCPSRPDLRRVPGVSGLPSLGPLI